MYPHPVDRYRLIGKFFWVWRETYADEGGRIRGLDQRALAREARLSQSTVSNIENLEKSIGSPKRRVSREDLIKVLTSGLNLEQPKIDAALWLYDCQPLTEEEIQVYVREYLPRACCENYRYEELRAIILDSLEETLQHSQSRVNKPAKPPKVMTSGEEKAHLEALEEMIELEETPGERMVLMRYPSLATLSAEVYQERLAHRSPLAADLADRLRYLNQMRLHHLNLYGERGIHHRASIENYVEAGATDLSATQRRQQIERWIELLEDSRNQHYEVRLTEPELGFELNLKTVPPLMLGVRVNEQTPFTTEGGKSQWMKLYDQITALFFLLAFERHWDSVPMEYRAKARIIEFLRYVLDKSRD